MVLHYRPKSPDNVLHQHSSMRHPKQTCQWWEIANIWNPNYYFSLSLVYLTSLSFENCGVQIRFYDHTCWFFNGIISILVEGCSTKGLWERLTTVSPTNAFWQQIRVVNSQWKKKDRIVGLVLLQIPSWAAMDLKEESYIYVCLIAQTEISLRIFWMFLWDCVS